MTANQTLLRFIRDLLDTLSQLPKTTHCPDCGSVMEQRTTTFSLAVTGETWDVALPICSKCAPVEGQGTAVDESPFHQ
jgi:hypothetical protein